MRTIEVCLYKFDELSEDAKRNALDNYNVDTVHYWNDAHQTVKDFHNLFGTREGRDSWLDIYIEHVDSNILELSGFRLQKFLWNNFHDVLFSKKTFSLWSKKDVSYKHYKDGYPVLKQRKSKVLTTSCCVLTGWCYDDDILEPIYKFLECRNFDNSPGFEGLLYECLESLRKSLENEDEYNESDEAKIREIEANDYEFDEVGNIA